MLEKERLCTSLSFGSAGRIKKCFLEHLLGHQTCSLPCELEVDKMQMYAVKFTKMHDIPHMSLEQLIVRFRVCQNVQGNAIHGL